MRKCGKNIKVIISKKNEQIKTCRRPSLSYGQLSLDICSITADVASRDTWTSLEVPLHVIEFYQQVTTNDTCMS